MDVAVSEALGALPSEFSAVAPEAGNRGLSTRSSPARPRASGLLSNLVIRIVELAAKRLLCWIGYAIASNRSWKQGLLFRCAAEADLT